MNFHCSAKLVVVAAILLLLFGHFPEILSPYITGNIYLYIYKSIYCLVICILYMLSINSIFDSMARKLVRRVHYMKLQPSIADHMALEVWCGEKEAVLGVGLVVWS